MWDWEKMGQFTAIGEVNREIILNPRFKNSIP
jgi:hypothetical protein